MHPYPLFFEPILKPRVWGGRRLERYGKALPPTEPIGESWEVADLPQDAGGEASRIVNGDLAGRTLREALRVHREAIMGQSALTDAGGFPLLIKYLDARDNLSMQVHPDEQYAAAHPGVHLKSEAWYIVEAEPGAVIYKGVREDVTRDAFAHHIETGDVIDDLIAVEARPGECHYLPSGTCHALGAGVFVAEVQTPSDTTFRVYDWGRTGRELHINEALQCIQFGGPKPSVSPPEPIRAGGFETRDLCTTDFFRMERIDAEASTSLAVVTNGTPLVWMILAGAGVIETPGAEDATFSQGTTLLLPARIEGACARFHSAARFLQIAPPSPLRHLIA